jgi:hypothetical protein
MSASYPQPPPGQPPAVPPYAPPQYAQGYGPPPAGYPPYGYAPPVKRSLSTAAIVSFAFGIGAWIILPFIAAIVAVISGHMARREIRASQGRLDGEGFAVAGLVLGYIHLAFSVLLAIVIIWLIAVYHASGANEAALILPLYR